MGMRTSIALLGEYSAEFEPHVATSAAIEHSATALGVSVDANWVSTVDVDETLFDDHQAIWVAPGSPYKNMQNTLSAIRHAREQRVPCLGTCGGFQHIVIEYARNVLGFADAEHAEYDPYSSNLFISELECSLAGRALPLKFAKGSHVAKIYGALSATEQYYCNFGVNPDHVGDLSAGPLDVVGSDEEGEIRIVELFDHPFYVATLFVPQLQSTPLQPHPLVTAFLEAAMKCDRSDS